MRVKRYSEETVKEIGCYFKEIVHNRRKNFRKMFSKYYKILFRTPSKFFLDHFKSYLIAPKTASNSNLTVRNNSLIGKL